MWFVCRYAVVLIALFNVWDLVGRYVPLIKCISLESRKGLTIACLSRLLLVPCFYFTAKYGDQGWMLMLVSVLGLTNGYLTVCVLTAAPRGYKVSLSSYSSTTNIIFPCTTRALTKFLHFQAPEQNALGNILVVFLLGGIFSGVVLDWLWIIGHGSFWTTSFFVGLEWSSDFAYWVLLGRSLEPTCFSYFLSLVVHTFFEYIFLFFCNFRIWNVPRFDDLWI